MRFTAKLDEGYHQAMSSSAMKSANGLQNKKMPVQIVRPDPIRGGFTVDRGIVNLLFCRESVADLPVAVYSVAGAFRKGKSFILNFFLRFLRAAAQHKASRIACCSAPC